MTSPIAITRHTTVLDAVQYRRRVKEKDFRALIREAALICRWVILFELPDAAYRLLAKTAREDPAQAHLSPPDGWPDLVLSRGDQVLFVELKTDTGKPSSAQVATLDALLAGGLSVHLWTPSDWDLIVEVLR